MGTISAFLVFDVLGGWAGLDWLPFDAVSLRPSSRACLDA
jgi:hypothetical protein